MNKWAGLTFTVFCAAIVTTVFVMDIKSVAAGNTESIRAHIVAHEKQEKEQAEVLADILRSLRDIKSQTARD